MQKDFFLTLKNLFEKTQPLDPELDSSDLFMTIRYLSLHPATFLVAESANRLSRNLPARQVWQYLYYAIDKRKAPFIPYPKKEVVKKEKNLLELQKKIGAVFCCSPLHAQQIIKIYKRANIDIAAHLGIGA